MIANRILSLIFVLLVLPCATTLMAQEEPIVRCKSHGISKKSIDYKVGLEFRTRGPGVVASSAVVQVCVEPQHINREDLVTLASQFNQDFCKEDDLMVSLFTDPRYIDMPVIPGLWGYKGGYEAAANSIRGFYYVNRNTGEGYISFSSVPNYDKHPESRIRIDLTKLR